MPINIQSLNSNVNVVDGNNMVSEEVMEQIVKQVMLRLEAEQIATEQLQEESDIRDRMTEG